MLKYSFKFLFFPTLQKNELKSWWLDQVEWEIRDSVYIEEQKSDTVIVFIFYFCQLDNIRITIKLQLGFMPLIHTIPFLLI